MNTTEDRPQLTNEQINAILGSQSTTEVEAILDVTTDVTSVDALVKYNLTESNFKGEVEVSEVESEIVIEVPEGNTYIGEFMTDLPDNVMFNKVTTGSGMTTLALTNEVKYVIAVPYVNLLLNKEVFCTNNSIDALFVHAKGHREEDIYSYTGNKIMVTYDSLHKVTSILKENRDISEWKLFVDESHTLLQSAGYRYKAVNSVLNNFKEYGSYVFGTATPVLDKYKLTETKRIQKCRLQWSNLEEVIVERVEIKEDDSLNNSAATIIYDHYTNKREGNAHIFVNSVKLIVQMFKAVNKLGIKTTDIRVVCSNDDYNTKTLAKEGLAIGTVDSDLRGINFYTSTAFEGCDINDVNGKTYVVVDANREHTAIDIYTTLPQIIGRIRDTKYKNQCTLIVDPSNKYLLGAEEFEISIRKHIATGLEAVKNYNTSSQGFKELIKQSLLNSNYVIYNDDTDTLSSNENAHLSDLNNFEAKSNPLYVKSNKAEDFLGKHINNSIVTNYIKSNVLVDELLFIVPNKNGKAESLEKTLKSFCKHYTEAKTDTDAQEVVRRYTEACEFVGVANKLGVDRIKALGYRKRRIVDEINFTDPCTRHDRELKLLNTLKLKAGQWYSNKVLKAKIQKIYNQQGIYAMAKIKDLTGIYDMKPKRMVVKKAKTSGVVITAIKLKVNN